MKKLFTLFALTLCLTNGKAQFVTIPDANFVTWLQANVPSAMSGNQMDTTDVAVTTYSTISFSNLGITDITGVQYFDSCKTLSCAYNQLTTIPALPPKLTFFHCPGNQITSIPSLPNNIKYINCSNNLLSNLPNLPNSLIALYCQNNFLSSLPILPLSIVTLFCQNNNINCFAPFNQITNFDISNNPFTCLPNYIPAMNAGTLNYPLCAAGNTNGCNSSAGIIGFTYKDNNTNCSKDAGDNVLKNISLQIYDNTGTLLSQTYSAINGVYQFLQTANTYTMAIDTTGLPFTSACLFPGLDSTVTVATLDTNINFGLTCKPGFDVGVQSVSTNGIIFPGQNHVLNVNAGDMTHWYNLNCASGTSGTLSFSISGPVTYVGPSAGALNPIVAGNVFTYNIADFGAINNSTDFQLIFQTDTTAQGGDVICVNATVTPISGDNYQTNNTYTFCYNVVNSYDPNIKETYPENVQPGFNDWLTYTIHFQNTGNAPAFNIRLADTLDTMLDLETFQVINYSHQNLIDLTGRVLNVRFPNIQLPDSTTNSAGSKGFIQYRLKPKATWAAPYQIKNTAYIYFDYNAPIVTNTTLNTILIPTGLKKQTETVMNLYPNPSNGNFTIELNSKEKQSIQVFDITGNVVLSQTIENGKTIIDGSHLASGIYNINIKGSNSVANKKLVIVK
jgi:uncharacterized repeat protein (TIGR01451 family)